MVLGKMTRLPTETTTAIIHEALRPLQSTSVQELIEPPAIVDPDITASKIIGVMSEKKVYDVFIPLANKIVCINIRDLLSIRDITAARPSVLGKIVPSLSLKSNVGYAARIMSLYRLRALPVEKENNNLVGQIIAKRILKAIHDLGADEKVSKNVRVSGIMTTRPVVLREKDKVSTARSIMTRRRIDHIPLVNENENLTGMLTSSHIIEAMLPSEKIGRKALGVEKLNRLDLQASGIADKNVVVSKPNDSLRSAVGTIIDANSTYSVVCFGEEIQGIVTYRDIISLLVEKVVEDLPAFIIGLPDDPFDAELAKSKFADTVRFLKRMAPEIEEARCKMKLRDIEGERRRNEVDVSIITPYRRHVYTNIGWDLAKMFDQMSDSLKKRFAHRRTRRQAESVRRTDTSSE
jgi:CBS domain-containing protein